ncbi:hypothetical protein [Paracoccus sp. (in: a-proteobacteria)]|uniref:hypothetical protein n=1 Tax=Paracoccus sp. TaxID=267 RepID=UPI00272A8E66|nr:hypothetical protein [Paracoccus sp. (in: a-proteobacteria)]
MTQIIPGEINTSNGWNVVAYELDAQSQHKRIVAVALGERSDSDFSIHALSLLSTDQARELAFNLIDAADLAEGECHLRRLTARAVLP